MLHVPCYIVSSPAKTEKPNAIGWAFVREVIPLLLHITFWCSKDGVGRGSWRTTCDGQVLGYGSNEAIIGTTRVIARVGASDSY